MVFKSIVPILYSADVARSLTYYTEVLGFTNKWDWDNPPTFGGVSRDSVEIYFCKEGQGNPGTWLSIHIDNVDEFYEMVKAKGAKILNPPENMEWGIREMLVEDPDGHKIRVGQNAHTPDRQKSESQLPATVKIIERQVTAIEEHELAIATGWSSEKDSYTQKKPATGIVHAVVAEDTTTGKIIGSAMILGDNNGFYYVKNVMVAQEWKSKQVGSALMYKLMDWLNANAPDNSSAYLHTGEHLAPFYRQFGFVPCFGMYRHLKKD